MARQDRNPYEVLGLEPSATRVEIRAAYLRLAKKHHPDKNPGDKASEWIFKEVGRAYETLGGTSAAGRTRDSGSRRERAGQPHARGERQAREQERERRERAEYGHQQDRDEQQARERAEHARRTSEERHERNRRRDSSYRSRRKHGESTASEYPLLTALACVLALPDRFNEFFAREHPLPTALVYAVVVPSALIGSLVLSQDNITAPELLGAWLFFAGLLAAAMRSKSKDALYWLGVMVSVAIGVWWVWGDLPQ